MSNYLTGIPTGEQVEALIDADARWRTPMHLFLRHRIVVDPDAEMPEYEEPTLSADGPPPPTVTPEMNHSYSLDNASGESGRPYEGLQNWLRDLFGVEIVPVMGPVRVSAADGGGGRVRLEARAEVDWRWRSVPREERPFEAGGWRDAGVRSAEGIRFAPDPEEEALREGVREFLDRVREDPQPIRVNTAAQVWVAPVGTELGYDAIRDSILREERIRARYSIPPPPRWDGNVS